MKVEEAPTGLPKVRKQKVVLRPLATSTYLLRNAGKTIPLTGVIMAAVLLVAGIVSMINSIPYSIKVIYSYSKESLGISPRGDAALAPKLVRIIKRETPVPVQRIIVCRASGSQVRSIVGKWPFVVLGMKHDDMVFFFNRLGAKQISGRYPKEGAPEAIISEPVARNKNLKLGDFLLGPDQPDNYSPYNVKVVGIAKTDQWSMATSYGYLQTNHFPPIDNVLVFARDQKDQDVLDHWAVKRFKGARAQIFAFFKLEDETNQMFSILYQILNVVIGTLVLVITFMMGMLMNIYQSQRLVEFGLLQAIGYTRKQLLRRVFGESLAVLVAGWSLGVATAYGLLILVKHTLMDPKAFALNPLDPTAFQYTLPIPLAILVVAAFTVALRFRKFDPVGVVERRLV